MSAFDLVDVMTFHQNGEGNSQTFAKSAEVHNLSSIITSTALLLEKLILFFGK